MKKLSTLTLLLAVLFSLSAGCKKKEEAPAEPPAQAATEEAPAADQQELQGDDSNAEDADDSDEEADDDQVDEAVFIKAAYEVSCVKSKISDPAEQKEILEIIYPRYGFETVEEYQAAEAALKDSTSLKAALDDKMKGCTEEVARGFKTAGADEAPAAAEGDAKDAGDAKKAAPKAAFRDGAFKGSYGGGGIKNGTLNCNAYRGKLQCSITGAAEGKGFSVPASGSVDRSGRFSISGSAGSNKASVSGQLKGTKAIGSMKLNIFQRDYTVNFSI